jgi:hypothetical protein
MTGTTLPSELVNIPSRLKTWPSPSGRFLPPATLKVALVAMTMSRGNVISLVVSAVWPSAVARRTPFFNVTLSTASLLFFSAPTTSATGQPSETASVPTSMRIVFINNFFPFIAARPIRG